MTKKLKGRALSQFESGRDIWQEVLEGVKEIKAGGGKRVSAEPTSPIADTSEIRPYAGAIRQFARCIETHLGAMGTRTPGAQWSGEDTVESSGVASRTATGNCSVSRSKATNMCAQLANGETDVRGPVRACLLHDALSDRDRLLDAERELGLDRNRQVAPA